MSPRPKPSKSLRLALGFVRREREPLYFLLIFALASAETLSGDVNGRFVTLLVLLAAASSIAPFMSARQEQRRAARHRDENQRDRIERTLVDISNTLRQLAHEAPQHLDAGPRSAGGTRLKLRASTGPTRTPATESHDPRS